MPTSQEGGFPLVRRTEPPSGRKMLVAGICLTVVGGMLLEWGLIGVARDYLELRGIRDWPTAPGRIVVSEKLLVRRDRFEDWNARIRYEYEAGGRSFTGQTVSMGFLEGQTGISTDTTLGTMPLFNEEWDASAVVQKYPAGADVLVHYSPDDPEIACLETGDPHLSDFIISHLASLLWGAIMTCVGILLIVVS
jgi:hypothetical protein